MSNPWFRMYAEFAHDPKVQMMPEAMQRRLVMLLCNRCSNVASVACATELCFMLRISEEELEETKALFIKKSFIDATWNLLHWEKRQYTAKSSTERSRRHRDKNKNTNATEMQRHATDATPNATQCNAPDTDTDTDTEQKVSTEEFALTSEPQPPPENLKSKKGTRLPETWEIPHEWGEWADRQGLTVDEINLQEKKFKNHWLSTTRNPVKRDWKATWENWVLEYLERKNNGLQTKRA